MEQVEQRESVAVKFLWEGIFKTGGDPGLDIWCLFYPTASSKAWWMGADG